MHVNKHVSDRNFPKGMMKLEVKVCTEFDSGPGRRLTSMTASSVSCMAGHENGSDVGSEQ